MATTNTRPYHVEHVIAHSLYDSAQLSAKARLLSANIASFTGHNNRTTPVEDRIMQTLHCTEAQLEEARKELLRESTVWTVVGTTERGLVYVMNHASREALTLPEGWSWAYDLQRKAALKWLARYSLVSPENTVTALALATVLRGGGWSVLDGNVWLLFEHVRELEDSLAVLADARMIEWHRNKAGRLVVRWTRELNQEFQIYKATFFDPPVDGLDAETAYGVAYWERHGFATIRPGDTWRFYTLTDPREPDAVRYVGTSTDPAYRFHNGHAWNEGENNNVGMRRWISELKDLGLLPILTILSETVTGDRTDAESREGDLVRKYAREGHPLLNIEHLYVEPRTKPRTPITA